MPADMLLLLLFLGIMPFVERATTAVDSPHNRSHFGRTVRARSKPKMPTQRNERRAEWVQYVCGARSSQLKSLRMTIPLHLERVGVRFARAQLHVISVAQNP